MGTEAPGRKGNKDVRTCRVFADRDLLTEAVLGRMLAGLSSRRYPNSLEPVGDVDASGTSRSAVSRRFVVGTEAKLAELFGRPKREAVEIGQDGASVDRRRDGGGREAVPAG